MLRQSGSIVTAALAVSLCSHLAPLHAQGSPIGFRSLDGTENNGRRPEWGAAGETLRRLGSLGYADGAGAPAGVGRPSARLISNTVCAQIATGNNEVPGSAFVWQWGQFLDHDLSLTETTTEAFDIQVPQGDPWFDPTGTGTATISLHRSNFELVGSGQIRQQTNDLTAWIDGSQVYGSDLERALALLQPSGLLATSAGNLLPYNTGGLHNAPSNSAVFFVAGDIRANEQVGLAAMHTLFVREHNRIAQDLRRGGVDPYLTYQVTRALIGANLQAITYREFLPVLLGPDAIPPYRGYRADRDPTISNMFSTAAYRLGHSMLGTEMLRLDAEGNETAAGHLSLQDAFFAPSEIENHGIDGLLRGLAAARAEKIDPYIVDDVRNFLFGPPGAGGFDLASLNIQRGRDHGLPSYADACRDMGLPAPRGFADITSDRDLQAKLRSVYGQPEAVDLWVGGLAEDAVPGAMVGRLFREILIDQFTRLRDGDRYYYENWLPRDLIRQVEGRTLARVIRDNTGVGRELPDNVFLVGGQRRRRR